MKIRLKEQCSNGDDHSFYYTWNFSMDGILENIQYVTLAVMMFVLIFFKQIFPKQEKKRIVIRLDVVEMAMMIMVERQSGTPKEDIENMICDQIVFEDLEPEDQIKTKEYVKNIAKVFIDKAYSYPTRETEQDYIDYYFFAKKYMR